MEYLTSQIEEISFIDVGCSGSLSTKWSELFSFLAYTGFDPNADECNRLKHSPNPYKSATYLPYAIAGSSGTQTLYRTQSGYCDSLLLPNTPWLQRFSYANLFEVIGQTEIECVTLDELVKRDNLESDILKLDTQGLELPILQAGHSLIEETFCIETETGFLENYHGETTYAEIDLYMRANGFLLFDMNIHRIARKDTIDGYGTHQPLWCETIWLYDVIGQAKRPSRMQALKSLYICAALQFYDYGLELARYYYRSDIIEEELFHKLVSDQSKFVQQTINPIHSNSGKLLKTLPKGIQKRIAIGINELQG